jgi:hypothetical protein
LEFGQVIFTRSSQLFHIWTERYAKRRFGTAAEKVFRWHGSHLLLYHSKSSTLRPANIFARLISGAIMGIVQFSSNAVVEVPPSSNLDNILTGITKMQQQQGGTNTFAGINLGQVSLLAAARNNTPLIMILMTDGQSNEGGNPIPAADKAKSLGIEIIVMGVGDGVDWNSLNQIASPPAENHRFNVTSFGDLQSFMQKLLAKTCLRVISLDPATGPAEGGTAVVITGEGFENYETITCKFGALW